MELWQPLKDCFAASPGRSPKSASRWAWENQQKPVPITQSEIFKAVGDEEMEEKFAKPKLEPIIYVVSKGLRVCFPMVIDLLKK